MKVLLDTSAYSELKRGHPGVASIVRRSSWIFFSPVVAGELLHGFRRGSRHEENALALRSFLGNPYVSLVPVTLVTAERFALIAFLLRSKGTPIPTNDIWIAAQALETGADLVSFDDHFRHVDGLAWLRPPVSGGA
jgi:tRNA(fMet)-specific endonuclease VapC